MRSSLSEAAIARPLPTLAIAALVAALAVPGLFRLELRTDGAALVPEGAPEVRADREIRTRFDLRDPLAVVLHAHGEDGIFRAPILHHIRRLTEALGELDGLRPHDIGSLVTEPGFRHRPGSLLFRNLLEEVPESDAAIEELRSDLRRIELYDGIFVSSDGQRAAILIATPPFSASEDRFAFVARVGEVIGSLERVEGLDASIVGAPVAEALLGRHILSDLGLPEGVVGADIPALDSGHPRLGPGMVPIAIASLGLFFLLVFRRWPAALLPLSEVGFCLLVVFGVMGFVGVPIYLTTVVMPVILAAVGTADEIHIFRRYLDLCPGARLSDSEHRRVVGQALAEMAPPVFRTSITTSVAFLAFAVSALPPIRSFGVFTALGVLVCLVYSLSVVPALLVVLGSEAWQRPGDEAESGAEGNDSGRSAPRNAIASRFARLAEGVASRRRGVLLGALVLALLATDGVRRLRVQDGWLDGFAESSSFARATREFDRYFLGSHLLRIELGIPAPRLEGVVGAEALGTHHLALPVPILDQVTADLRQLEGSSIRLYQRGIAEPREWQTWLESARREGDRVVLSMPKRGGSAKLWLRPGEGEQIAFELRSEPLKVPGTLEHVAALESFVRDLDGVGGVLGPATYLATTRFLQTAVRTESDEARGLPATPREAANLWNNYGRIRGAERLAQLVDGDFRRGLITVFLEGSDYAKTKAILEAIDGYWQESLELHGIELAFAGDVAVSQASIRSVVDGQLRSLALSLLAILLVTTVLSRSFARGLLCLLPPSFAILANFALMGWLGIPLGIATSMFACMTLGVGVDFAIHLLARLEREQSRARGGAGEGRGAMERALAIVGPAILIDAGAVALGFGLLFLSQVPSTARLGLLLAFGVLACLMASLLLIPAWLATPSSRDGDSKEIHPTKGRNR